MQHNLPLPGMACSCRQLRLLCCCLLPHWLASAHAQQGIVTIPGRELEVPKAPKLIQPMPSFEEQGLCIGATFALAATNGKDFERRINILGFCQSVDVLNEALEETVMSRGGEVLEQELKLKSGVHEQVGATVMSAQAACGRAPCLPAVATTAATHLAANTSSAAVWCGCAPAAQDDCVHPIPVGRPTRGGCAVRCDRLSRRYSGQGLQAVGHLPATVCARSCSAAAATVR